MARKKNFARSEDIENYMTPERLGRTMTIRQNEYGDSERAMVAAEAALNIREVMLTEFRRVGVSKATFLMELLSVARAAAAEGEYTPSIKAYEMIGKQLGCLVENHQHLHVTGTASERREALALQGRSDAELEAIASRSRSEADVLS